MPGTSEREQGGFEQMSEGKSNREKKDQRGNDIRTQVGPVGNCALGSLPQALQKVP